MAAKKRPPRAAKATQIKKKKKKAPTKKAAPARKVAVTGQTLRLAAKQGDVQVRRAGEAYVEKATELEAARIERAQAEQALAAFYAAEAAREKRPFFNFLAQGDSWFDYTCGFAIIHWLQALFKPKNAYFKNIAASGRTLRQMLSRDFKDKLAAGPLNGARWSGILLSGGGNDICGDHRFRDWLNPNGGGAHPPDYYITCGCRKPRSGRIDGAVRQPGHATRCVRSAEPSERLAHLGPMTGAFAPYCNNERTLAGSAADAPRPARRCGPRTRGVSFQSTARQTNSATASPL